MASRSRQWFATHTAVTPAHAGGTAELLAGAPYLASPCARRGVAGEFPQEPRWLCFTWDGNGLGEDGTLWGGEALLGSPGCCPVSAHSDRLLRPVATSPHASPGVPRRPGLEMGWIGVLPASTSGWHEPLGNNAELSTNLLVGRLFDGAAAF